MTDTELIERLAKWMDGQSYSSPSRDGTWITQFPHVVVKADDSDFTPDHLRRFIERLSA